MFCNVRLHKFGVVLTTLVAVLAVASQGAQAQVKPFKISGGGNVPDGLSLIPGVPSPHDAVGNATQLGKYHGEGNFQLLAYTSALTAEFSSAPDFVFTAANGDDLAFTYGDVNNDAQPGEVELFPLDDGSLIAVFVAEFNPVPAKCTGRFAKVVGGSFIMVAVSEPFFFDFDNPADPRTTPFEYSWDGEGSLTFEKGK
jgi:hypothetical protein